MTNIDLKPKNILVRDIRANKTAQHTSNFKVYIADFGTSRSYDILDATETNGPTMYTRVSQLLDSGSPLGS
jgi:serine/threonine protein kinase